MKVCLVTFSASYNFGASLQAYALQEKLKEIYGDVQILDIRKEAHRKAEYYSGLKGLALNWLVFLHRRKLEAGNTAFERFSDERFSLTKANYHIYATLESDPPEADLFVSGSDQVFNPEVHSMTYMLGFVPDGKIRVSFAASMGRSSVDDKDKEAFVALLKRFDALSIREESSARLLKQYTDKDIQTNVDPVFFYDSRYWSESEKPVDGLSPQEYILVYCVYRPKDINRTIRELKKRTGKKVVILERRATRFIFGGKLLLECGPQEFLWLARNAYMIYTTSFHGLAFGLIFGKKLYVRDNPTAPLRITDLLKKLGAVDLLTCSLTEAIQNEPVDVRDRIEEEKKKGEQYLRGVQSKCR